MHRADCIESFCNFRELVALAGVSARIRASLAGVAACAREASRGIGVECINTLDDVSRFCIAPMPDAGILAVDLAVRAAVTCARAGMFTIARTIARYDEGERDAVEKCAVLGSIIGGHAEVDGIDIVMSANSCESVIGAIVQLVVQGRAGRAHFDMLDRLARDDYDIGDRLIRVGIHSAIRVAFAECLANVRSVLARDFIECIVDEDIEGAMRVIPVSFAVMRLIASDAMFACLAHAPFLANDIGPKFEQQMLRVHAHEHIFAHSAGDSVTLKLIMRKLPYLIPFAFANPDARVLDQMIPILESTAHTALYVAWNPGAGTECLRRILSRAMDHGITMDWIDNVCRARDLMTRLSHKDVMTCIDMVLEHAQHTMKPRDIVRTITILRGCDPPLIRVCGDAMRELLLSHLARAMACDV